MICLACGVENPAQARACGACGSPDLSLPRLEEGARPPAILNDAGLAAVDVRIAALTQQLQAIEAERTAIYKTLALAQSLSHSRAAGVMRAPVTSAPFIERGALRATIGGSLGTSIEVARAMRTAGSPPRRRPGSWGKHPRIDVRRDVISAVFADIEDGATVVNISGPPGSGATTVLEMVAERAIDHGFVHGGYILGSACAPVADIAQRLARKVFDDDPVRVYTPSELTELFSDLRVLVLLDRAQLSSEEQLELRVEMPGLTFVIADAPADPERPSIRLEPLTAGDALKLVDAGYGRSITGAERAAALAICGTHALYPGRARLLGAAVNELGESFEALAARSAPIDRIVGALIAGLTLIQARTLGILNLIRIPLTAEQIATIGQDSTVEGTLERLIACELVRVTGQAYELPRDIAPLVPELPDSELMFGRAIETLALAFDPGASPTALDEQLYAAEPLVTVAFEQTRWVAVPVIGMRLAQTLALRGAFGAWGRMLNFLTAAAKLVNDPQVLSYARHELGARALLCGDHHKAQQYLASALQDRENDGDEIGAAQTRSLLARAKKPARSPRRPREPDRPAHAVRALSPPIAIQPPMSIEPPVVVPPTVPALAPPVEAPLSEPGAPLDDDFAVPAELPPEVAQPTRPLVLPAQVAIGLGGALFVVALFLGWIWARPALSSAVATQSEPRAATRSLLIEDFRVSPAHLIAGDSARLCYAVTGADFIRMIPNIGELTHLRSCHRVFFNLPRRYTYSLVALGADKQLAIRRLHIDVGPRPSRVHPAARPNRSPAPRATPVLAAAPIAHIAARPTVPYVWLARHAIYQFEITPHTVERGQTASLCVGVGRAAKATVTTIGALQPGITRCFLVAPTESMTYSLNVTIGRSRDVETTSVNVRQPVGRHDRAHFQAH